MKDSTPRIRCNTMYRSTICELTTLPALDIAELIQFIMPRWIRKRQGPVIMLSTSGREIGVNTPFVSSAIMLHHWPRSKLVN
eukprot:6209852-Pleurochrysis_carterae.AAC.1